MSFAYVDTSWLIAILFGETGWKELADQLDTVDGLYSSNLLEAELRSAVSREGVAMDPAALSAVRWVMPDRPLSGEIATVLEAGQLRGADLWHVSCALFVSGQTRELTFLTLGERQSAVAQSLGFPTARP